MFAKSIVLSDAFLDMPMSARCLYFTLGMLADDDGFVNAPRSIMRQCGASDDDMKILLAKKYVLLFDSGVIVIKHWRINNYLRNDRYTETWYTEEKARRMAEPYGIDIFRLKDKQKFLKDIDILISATSAPDAIIHPSDLTPGRPLLAIDLAFPRDIDPEVAKMQGVTLYNLHDVEQKVKANISVREDEVKKAEQMIEEAITELHETLERRKQYKKAIRITARSSRLSQIQVNEVLKRFPNLSYQLVTRRSYGDKHMKISLLNGEAPDDMFTRELDMALLSGKADIAIHSAKDLPEKLHPDLEVIALYEAFDKTDSLISRDHISLADLPEGSTIGTSSPLRKKELESIRPDLKVVGIRGCIEERVEQVRDGKIDAVIVATCALKRLDMEDEITEVLNFETHPMQGRLAITALKGRDDLKAVFSKDSII